MTDEELGQIRSLIREETNTKFADMNLIAESLRRLQQDVASFRDDMRVLTAIAIRIDNTNGNLLEEVRATHAQVARMNDRIHRLESGHQ